jgi:methionyl-tRNA formyltransferase
MRIAAIGRTQFLYDAIGFLNNKKGFEIASILTARASPEYTRKEEDFRALAKKFKAYYSCGALNQRIKSRIRQSAPDIGVSVNWPFIIQRDFIDCFRLGILNAHFGDLPRYRGNACPNWAIINREKDITISVHLMEGGELDCGRIIVQDRKKLGKNTYIDEIYRWAADVIPGLFLKAILLLDEDPGYTLKYADADSPESFRCFPRRPEDSRINWQAPAGDIHRLIRASGRPFSGAFCFLGGKKLTIWRAEMLKDKKRYLAMPGQVCAIVKGSFTVNTGKGNLRITDWESAGTVKSMRQRLI